jgi:hypothetical protein
MNSLCMARREPTRLALRPRPVGTSGFRHDEDRQKFPSLYWVDTRIKPCLDGLKTAYGMGMVFSAPSPTTFE